MPTQRQANDEALNKMVIGAAAQVSPAPIATNEPAALSPDLVEQLRRKIKEKGRSIQPVPIALIHLDANIRRRYADESLSSLAESLRKDGLIQFPTLYLRESDKSSDLVCCNGHRRILAARSIGWTKIDCVILSFQSAREQLYHLINANMHENVHFLDLATAYADAYDFGESDEEIANRVVANPRTVGWYRRLAKMPTSCDVLAREYPDIFTATWAIKMARRGELPSEKVLHPAMQAMIAANRSWLVGPDDKVRKEKDHPASREKELRNLRSFIKDTGHEEQRIWAREFVSRLQGCGLLPKKSLKAIEQMLGCDLKQTDKTQH